jgi:hypothetical protein
LFAADVGQSVMEEVNLVEAGGDYGWPVMEGSTCFNSQKWNQPLSECTREGLADPIIAYAHAGDLSAVIGGSVYRGEHIPSLQGAYIFGDWGRGNGHLFAALPPLFGIGPWEVTELEVEMPGGGSPGQLLAVERDGEGELYLLVKDPGVGPTGSTGRVYKLVRE